VSGPSPLVTIFGTEGNEVSASHLLRRAGWWYFRFHKVRWFQPPMLLGGGAFALLSFPLLGAKDSNAFVRSIQLDISFDPCAVANCSNYMTQI
jgi:hypothetical protein